MNTYNAIGNLVEDAEFKPEVGKGLLKFRIAVNSGYGEKQKAMYFRCTKWGESGAKLVEMLTKGKKVAVTGELRPNEWEKDGVKRTDIEIEVRDMDFLSPKEGGAESAPARAANPAPAAGRAPARTPPNPRPAGKPADEDLPF